MDSPMRSVWSSYTITNLYFQRVLSLFGISKRRRVMYKKVYSRNQREIPYNHYRWGDGVIESEKETWEETEEKVLNIFTNELGIREAIVIERAHRTKKRRHSTNENRPQTIVLKLLNYKDKQKILKSAKKLRGTGIFINEDFSRETVEIRKKKWEKVLELRAQGKYAILQYDQIISRDFRS